MKICPRCGSELVDDAIYCINCGHKLQDKDNTNNTLKTLIKVLLILGCFGSVFAFLIPLAWSLPLTIITCRKLNENEDISIGLKIADLLLVNTIAGVLMLCIENKQEGF